ncbi:hypothetical protein Tco_0712515 [Tanacetum coccineum]
MFGSDTIKLDRMDGMNFTRWKEKMKFLLTAFEVYYVVEGPQMGVLTEEEQRKRDQDKTLCRGYILSTLTDRFSNKLYVEPAKKKEEKEEKKTWILRLERERLTISPNVEVSFFKLLRTTDDILVGVCFDLSLSPLTLKI